MITCDSPDQWIDDIVEVITESLETGIRTRGRASLLVSGGLTPVPIFRKLNVQNPDWSKVDIALVDERWVPPHHPASNEKLVRETLLVNKAGSASFTGMKTGHGSPREAVDRIEEAYTRLPRPIDIVLLGMGVDGHTASLFPNARGLARALNTSSMVAAVTARKSQVTGEHIERMTLTGPAIGCSRTVILALRGDKKRHVLEEAQKPGDSHNMPIRAVLGGSNLRIYWTDS